MNLLTAAKEKYRDLMAGHTQAPVFYQPWWLDAVCESNNWEVIISEDKGGNIAAALPYYRKKMKGISVLANPPLTPYLGVYLFYPENQTSITSRYSFENNHIRNIAGQLKNRAMYVTLNFHPDFNNWYPFFWTGYAQSTRYTYILKNIKDHEKTFGGFSNTLKRQIKNAEESIAIVKENKAEKLFQLMQLSLESQGLKWDFTLEKFNKLYDKLYNTKQVELLFARDKNGNTIAGTMLVWDKSSAYCLALGMDKIRDDQNAVKLLLWEAIKEASKRVSEYNFEGSMVQNVERVYRAFGGERVAYYHIKWYRNRIFKALMTLINK